MRLTSKRSSWVGSPVPRKEANELKAEAAKEKLGAGDTVAGGGRYDGMIADLGDKERMNVLISNNLIGY